PDVGPRRRLGPKGGGRMTPWRQARLWLAGPGAAVGVAAVALLVAGPASAQASVQLRFMSWYFGEDPAGPALKALFTEFEKRNPNIKVVAETGASAGRGATVAGGMEAGAGAGSSMGTPPTAPQ